MILCSNRRDGTCDERPAEIPEAPAFAVVLGSARSMPLEPIVLESARGAVEEYGQTAKLFVANPSLQGCRISSFPFASEVDDGDGGREGDIKRPVRDHPANDGCTIHESPDCSSINAAAAACRAFTLAINWWTAHPHTVPWASTMTLKAWQTALRFNRSGNALHRGVSPRRSVRRRPGAISLSIAL